MLLLQQNLQSGSVNHTTTGALTGQGASVAGSASRSATVSVSWVEFDVASVTTHATTGSLTGQIGSVAGSANRVHAFDSSGVLTGQGASVAGAANRTHAFSSSGALIGQAASVSGSASRTHEFSAVGVLSGQGAVVDGAASRSSASIGVSVSWLELDVASAAAVTHATTGALTGQIGSVSGSASRTGVPVSHETSGTLTGTGSSVEGTAQTPAKQTDNGWLGGSYDFLNPEKHHKPIPKKVRKLARYIAKKIVEDEPEKPVEVLQRDVIAELQTEMANRQQEWQAFYSVYIETLIIQARAQLIEKALQDEEDEAIVRLLFEFV